MNKTRVPKSYSSLFCRIPSPTWIRITAGSNLAWIFTLHCVFKIKERASVRILPVQRIFLHFPRFTKRREISACLLITCCLESRVNLNLRHNFFVTEKWEETKANKEPKWRKIWKFSQIIFWKTFCSNQILFRSLLSEV